MIENIFGDNKKRFPRGINAYHQQTESSGWPCQTGITYPNWRRVIPSDTIQKGMIDLTDSGFGKDRNQAKRLSVAFNAFVRQTGELINMERSSRAEIERKQATDIAVIRSQCQVMAEYLTHRFGERGRLYERYFQLVDTALELQNDEITRIALESILKVYQNSPGAEAELRRHIERISEVMRI